MSRGHKPSTIPLPNHKQISPSVRNLIFGRDGYRCRECGSTEDLTVDHVVPRCEGGRNGFDNLQALCRHCNNRKGNGVVVGRRNLRRQLAYETYVYLTSVYGAAEVAHLLPGLVADYASVRAEQRQAIAAA